MRREGGMTIALVVTCVALFISNPDFAGQSNAVNLLRQDGASDVIIAATHGVLSDPAAQRLADCGAREVIVKSDPELASIPVVILTTSEAEEDVLRSYSLHANAYVTKPVDFERFIRVVQQIDDFFVNVVKLPR